MRGSTSGCSLCLAWRSDVLHNKSDLLHNKSDVQEGTFTVMTNLK
jgi:hypothetical protein